MPELEWLELARVDLLSIVDYISDDNPDAAQRVKDDIETKARACGQFARLSRKTAIFEHRSGVYMRVNEQRSTENRGFSANIVELSTGPRKLSDFPKMGRPGRVEGTRELVVLKNYLIVYQENSVIIQILRVLHGAQLWPPPTVVIRTKEKSGLYSI